MNSIHLSPIAKTKNYQRQHFVDTSQSFDASDSKSTTSNVTTKESSKQSSPSQNISDITSGSSRHYLSISDLDPSFRNSKESVISSISPNGSIHTLDVSYTSTPSSITALFNGQDFIAQRKSRVSNKQFSGMVPKDKLALQDELKTAKRIEIPIDL